MSNIPKTSIPIDVATALPSLMDEGVRAVGTILEELGDMIDSAIITHPSDEAADLFVARRKRWQATYAHLHQRYGELMGSIEAWHDSMKKGEDDAAG